MSGEKLEMSGEAQNNFAYSVPKDAEDSLYDLYCKGDTLEASKSAHPFELDTVKAMHCTPAFQKTIALYMVL